MQVKPSYGLSEEQIEKMLLDSYEYAEEDLKARQLAEARVEAERILAALRAALAVDGQLLVARGAHGDRRGDRRALRQAARGERPPRRFARAPSELDLATKPFAEKRMNEGITRAIGGHQVGEIEEAGRARQGNGGARGLR